MALLSPLLRGMARRHSTARRPGRAGVSEARGGRWRGTLATPVGCAREGPAQKCRLFFLSTESIKAFVTLRVGFSASPEMRQTLQNHVRHDLGPIAQPGEIDFVDKLPKIRSGKIMRRLLKANALGLEPGDITTLED